MATVVGHRPAAWIDGHERSYRERWTLLCELLRAVRIEAGLTEAEVARRLGEPQSFVSKYETMRRRLDLIELQQVASALDTTLIAIVTAFESERDAV